MAKKKRLIEANGKIKIFNYKNILTNIASFDIETGSMPRTN